jgi:transposase
VLEEIRKKHPSVAEKEFHRSRWWAYKWLKRFDKEGLNGLKDRVRTGRPPEVSKETSTRIRRELSENQSGWMAKEFFLFQSDLFLFDFFHHVCHFHD